MPGKKGLTGNAREKTARSNLIKAYSLLREIDERPSRRTANFIAERSMGAMHQAATALLIYRTGGAPYKVVEVVAAVTRHINQYFNDNAGFAEDILFAYSLRTIGAYDVVYKATPAQAKDVKQRCRKFVEFCEQQLDEPQHR